MVITASNKMKRRLWFADPAGVFFVEMLVFNQGDEQAVLQLFDGEPGFLGMTKFGERPPCYEKFLEDQRVQITEAGISALEEERGVSSGRRMTGWVSGLVSLMVWFYRWLSGCW
jgi:hypothetical protein